MFVDSRNWPLREEPLVGKQLVEAVVRVGADAKEQIAKIGKGFDAQTFATCDQTAQYGSGSPAFVTRRFRHSSFHRGGKGRYWRTRSDSLKPHVHDDQIAWRDFVRYFR